MIETVIVFLGPTLPVQVAREVLDATYLPPAAQGDIYRATLANPSAIGLVDGYFSQVPAVWHKEILWAMARGIHVFGSASMGALRAAELSRFGMTGVGAVFDAYASGAIEDDDEVAVVHGPAELGYVPLSEAMVNMRASILEAERCGAASTELCARVLRAAKAAFYPDRSYELLREIDDPAAEPLLAWLQAHRIDQKREDALAMLGEMARRIATGLAPIKVDFTMERSFAFEHMIEPGRGD